VTLEYVSLGLIIFAVVVIVFGIVKLHEYPGLIAERRNHPQKDAIVACSLMGLLVFPFWMFALIWAYGGTIGTPLPRAATPESRPDSPQVAKKAEPRRSATPKKPGPQAAKS